MQAYVDAIRRGNFTRRIGRVTAVSGQTIESLGPEVTIGDVCEIGTGIGQQKLLAEVVGIKPGKVVLMPYGDIRGIASGNTVTATGQRSTIAVGTALLGRIIDAFGHPLDGGPLPLLEAKRPLQAPPLNPLDRPRIHTVMETGVRAIDCMLPMGRGQRMGIFAGSGVGKSTLLGMLAREMKADVNVIALIGERGREVREFIDIQLGEKGLERSVLVVATSDQPALMRTRAAHAATAIAEYFRDAGKHVLLTMDSVTRFAMARREIGLAAGEPPTARGYTPSVFADIPILCERCGTKDSGGSITAVYTVLVEGDDFNEPISDIVRATLDGHIVLTRELAHDGHFPAIDVLQSTSRLATELTTVPEKQLMSEVIDVLSTYDRNRQMIDMGAYRSGSNPVIDHALQKIPAIRTVLRQAVSETTSRTEALRRLQHAVGSGAT